MDSSSDALEPVELLADEFMERQRAGEQPTIDEYVEGHPDLASEIREVFPALVVIEQIAPASADLQQSQTSHESPAHVRVSEIGDYRILREIGRGGMGVVYEAEQQSLRRRVALKVLPRQIAGDDKALKRFQQEARAAARMHHTNIVPVFEVGDDEEHVFYAMQLIQGQGLDVVIDDVKQLRSDHNGQPVAPEDLSQAHSIAASLVMGGFEQQKLAAGDSDQPGSDNGSEEYNATVIAETAMYGDGSTPSAVLPGQSEISTAETDRGGYYRSVARIGHQTAGALSYAHVRGIIHRDIKPSNLLLDTAGVVWVTDFGLAKTGDEALTHTGDILGTLRYMSPERFKGQCDVRADVYSLGLTLYELLVLKPAFSSPDRLKLIEMVSKSEPPTPRSIDPRIPRDLETIILKSIDKDPRRRYPTADDLADDLERFIQDEPINARRISMVERLGRWSRRNKPLAASLAIVTTLLVVIALGSVFAAGHFRSLSTSLATTNKSLATTLGELETQKGLAEQAAEQNRDLAEDNRIKADAALAAQTVAEEAQETLQRELYVSDMLQARLAYQEGAVDRLVELLTRHIPSEGETDQRGWEWFYWWRASRLHQQQIRIGTPLRDMAVAPDASWVAVRAWDQYVVIFHPETMARLARLRGCHWGDFEIQLAVSPDGSLLAALGNDGDVKLWRTDDWSELPPLRPLPEPGRALKVVAFSPTGLLAAGDAQGRITFWNAEVSSREGPSLETGQRLGCLVFSPDGSRLVTGDGVALNANARGLLIWNLADRSETPLLEGESGVTALHWTIHEGRSVIASGNVDGGVRLWDAETSTEFARMSAGGPVESMSFSSDGSRLAASTSRNNAVRIWETGTGRLVATMRGHSRKVSGVCFVGDNRTVWSSGEDESLNVWDARQSEPFMRLQAPVDPDRARVITFGADSLSLWRYREPSSSGVAQEIRRWNTNSGEDLPPFDLGESTIAAISNNGRFLATVRRDAGGTFRLEIWRTDLAQPIRTRDEILPAALDDYVPIRLAVSDDGSTVAWTGNGKLVAINVDTGGYRIGNTGGDKLALSPDGRLLCVPTFWNTQVWDISGDTAVRRTDLSGDGPVFNARFSRDGKYVAVAHWNNDVRVHDAGTGELIHQFRGHAGSVFALDFSPDGRLLASGGFDGTVRLWDLDPDHPGLLLTLSAHETDVTSVAFSPDGRSIASISTDGDTRIWMGATDADLQQDVEYWTHRARAQESRQAWQAALADWTAVIRLAPDVPSHFERRGNLNLTQGRFSEAGTDFLASLTLDIQHHFDWLSALATWNPLPGLTQAADQSWRFTLEEPAGNWQDAEFDDSGWQSGGPRFETDSTGRGWPRNQIWLRREFVLAEPDIEQLAFLVYADDDVTIHVNGREAATAHWIGTGWYQVVPSAVPFRPGRNVVAVHCKNFGGHQGAVHIIPGRRNRGETLVSLVSAALEADPENETLLQQRADLYTLLERWDEAATDHIAILQLRSQAPDWIDGPGWNSQRSRFLPTRCANEELFHALRRQRPDSPDLWLARARSLALRSNWSAAAEAYARYDGPRPVNSEIAFEIACVQRIVGDEEGYRKTFNGLQDQAGEDPTPFAGFTLARTAGLAPQSPDLAEQAVGWARHGLTETREPWKLHALGLALFRAGDHDEAIEVLEESLAAGWSANQNQAALAIVCHDVGDEVQTHEFLSGVRTWVGERKQEVVNGAVNVQVIDWLAVHALLSEAEAVIDADEGATTR